MSIDLIRSIKNTEAEAEQLKKQALEDAREILSEASNQSYKMMEQAIEDAQAESKEIIKKAEELAKSDINKLYDEVEEECNTIREHGRKKLDKAIDIIIGRIVKTHGNS